MMWKATVVLSCSLLLVGCATQHTPAGHAGHKATSGPAPTEVGQSAFAAIAEIVALLDADANTDWSRVDIEALRQHLIDMQRVTMQARVAHHALPQGQRFEVGGDNPEVVAAIQRMVLAHSAMMNGSNGWTLKANSTPTGANLEVTSKDSAQREKIAGLGFAGIMALGMHHQAHHWAIARGQPPH